MCCIVLYTIFRSAIAADIALLLILLSLQFVHSLSTTAVAVILLTLRLKRNKQITARYSRQSSQY